MYIYVIDDNLWDFMGSPRGFGFFASVTGVFCDGCLLEGFLRRCAREVFCISAANEEHARDSERGVG
jgi:hypothetical protein